MRCQRCGAELPRHYEPCNPTKVAGYRVCVLRHQWLTASPLLPLEDAVELRREMQRVEPGVTFGVFTRLGSRVLTSDEECVEAAQASRGRRRAA